MLVIKDIEILNLKSTSFFLPLNYSIRDLMGPFIKKIIMLVLEGHYWYRLFSLKQITLIININLNNLFGNININYVHTRDLMDNSKLKHFLKI